MTVSKWLALSLMAIVGGICLVVQASISADLRLTPWWAFLPGIFGATYIVIAILLLPNLGAATVIALIVTGQMVGSMIFDHFALFSLAKHHVDFPRLLGALLLVVGVALIRR
jgi:bacterial/archaeal transporter family-2 protein